MLWNSDSEKTQNNYIFYTPNSNLKFYMTREWWYLKVRHNPEVEHTKSLFTDAIVEIHLNVPWSSWDLGWPLAAGHGFSVTVRTTEMSGDKALLSPLQETCTKRVEKFHQHQISRAFIWMNAEFQEWLDWDQHLQGKEILDKLQQMTVFLPHKPHYKALVPSKLL